ncbi:hypothetical protein JB92DRAFT_2842651 [Gautieria morchelliformis]|nr:hypothetical protein JB92DRAFT_2842651 [Gautieria morchelliformis]
MLQPCPSFVVLCVPCRLYCILSPSTALSHTRSQSGTQSGPRESRTLGRRHHCDSAHRMPRRSSSSTSVAIMMLRPCGVCIGGSGTGVRGAACHQNILSELVYALPSPACSSHHTTLRIPLFCPAGGGSGPSLCSAYAV